MTFAPRITRDYHEYDAVIHDYTHLGYQLHYEDKYYSIMLKNPWGSKLEHFIIFLVLGWWTLGMANVLCLIYSRGTAERISIKKPPFQRQVEYNNNTNRNEFNPYIVDEAA